MMFEDFKGKYTNEEMESEDIQEKLNSMFDEYSKNISSDAVLEERYGKLDIWLRDWLSEFGAKKMFSLAPRYGFNEGDNEREKEWQTIRLRNKLDTKFFANAYRVASKFKRTYISIYETTEGIMFNYAYDGQHTIFNNRLIACRTTQYLTKGIRNFIILEYATDTEIRRTNFYSDSVTGMWKPITGSNLESKFGIKIGGDIQKHNYGFVPIVLIENIPNEFSTGRSDLQGQEPLINMLNKLWIRIGNEVDVNKTRINIYAGDGTKNEEIVKMIKANEITREMYETGTLTIIPGGDNVYDEGVPRPAEVVIGNPQTEVLFKAFQQILSMIFESAGFKFNSTDSKGINSTQKTEFEVNQTKDSEVVTFKMKQVGWQDAIKELIYKTFAIKGKKYKEDYEDLPTIDIHTIDTRQEQTLFANLKTQMELEIIDKSTAYSRANYVPIEEARRIMETMNIQENPTSKDRIAENIKKGAQARVINLQGDQMEQEMAMGGTISTSEEATITRDRNVDQGAKAQPRVQKGNKGETSNDLKVAGQGQSKTLGDATKNLTNPNSGDKDRT